MKKSVLFFSAVLMLLMSGSPNLFAQKNFPDNPNQGYADTGIGKGDLLNILNEGFNFQTSTVYPLLVSDNLLYEFVKDSSRLKVYDTNSDLAKIQTINTSFFGAYNDTDIALGDSLIAILAHPISVDRSNLTFYNLNTGQNFQGINTGLNGPIKARRIAAWKGTFYIYDYPNKRMVSYALNQNLGQFEITSELDLSQISAGVIDFKLFNDNIFVLSGGFIYKFNLSGLLISSIDLANVPGASAPGYSGGRMFIEENGRISISMTELGAQNPEQRIAFLTPALIPLGSLLIPSEGARGSFGRLGEIAVDGAGNIYLSSQNHRPIHQLEYVNHQPIYAPKPGAKTIFNAPNYSTQFYPPIEAYITEGFDYFDWNAGDQVGAVKITGLEGDAKIRYDSDDNGSYESTYIQGDTLELTIDDIINERMYMTINDSGADTLAKVDAVKMVFNLADRAGEFTADADTVRFSTYKAIFEFDGVSGKDSWLLMTSVIDGVTYEDYLNDLDILNTSGGNEKTLFPTNDTTYVYLYNSESEEYEPLNVLTDTLNRGDAFFVRIPEDTDTSTAGVQGGWPRIEFLNELERETVYGSDDIFAFRPDTFMVSLISNSVVDFPERNGVNLVGNPFGQTWRWSSNFAELAGVSPDIAVWNHLANNGDGAWEYPTYPNVNTEVWIKPDQAVAVFAEDANASLGFRYSGVTDDVVSPDVLGEEKFVVPKRILATLSDSTYSDSFYITKTGSVTGRRIPKMINITGNYHEVFAIGAGGEGDRNHYFSAANDFDTLGVAIKFGVRSTISDSATITIQAQDLSEFDSLYVKHSLLNGDSVFYQVNDGTFAIPLVDSGKEYTHEGTLEIILSKENRIINSNEEGDAPLRFSLSQNYPNPFNPSTQINFQVPGDGKVSLKVYDILGREVATLVNELKAAGSYSVNFDASTLSSGMYMYRLETTRGALTRKMMLMK